MDRETLKQEEQAHLSKLNEMISAMSPEEMDVVCEAMARVNPHAMLRAVSRYLGEIETDLGAIKSIIEQ